MKMQMLTVLLFILHLLFAEAEIALFVRSVSNFPHFIGEAFSLDIQSRSENGKLSSDPSDTMVIRIVDLNFTEIERAYLVYGALYFMDDEFKGNLMDIKIWEKNQMSTKIDISIIFKREAHNKYLEIFYFSAPNKFVRRKYLKNLSLAKRLFHELIDLFIPSTLALTLLPIKVDRKDIIINDMVMASCRAFGGIPQEKPRFEDHAQLNVTEIIYNETANEISMNLRTSLDDHLTNFSCSAGNVTETFIICIHHHPSKIHIKPDIKDILQANRAIQCYAQDGYPQPSLHFQLIKGPSNASHYYETRKNGSKIYIRSSAPTGSAWMFKCLMKSTIAGVAMTKEKNINFRIASHPTSILIMPVPDGIMEPNSTIACGPADGYPAARATWEVIAGPESASLYYNFMRNGTQIHLKENCPTKSEWEIKCSVKSCLENVCVILNRTISFRIANHPTALYIQPIIKKRFRSNSTIKCFTKDGYPDPEINWQLIEGPPNADRFYNIPGKGDQIHINSNSPVGSKWTLKCTMKSVLVNTKKSLNKTISFSIAKNPMEICGEKCLNSRISEIEESVDENERLQEDIRSILNQVKEQMIAMGKGQQKTSRGMNASIKQVKEQMIAMGKEQQEISKGLNASIKQMKDQIKLLGKEQQETSSGMKGSIKQVNEQLIAMGKEQHETSRRLNDTIKHINLKRFYHTYQLSYNNGYQSPPVSVLFPLFVYFFSHYDRSGFYCKLKFSNPQRIPANIDMKYKCEIFALQFPDKINYSTFDIKYRGASDMDTGYNRIGYKEISGYIRYSSVTITATCNLLSYNYLS